MSIYDDLIPDEKKKKKDVVVETPKKVVEAKKDYGLYQDLVGKAPAETKQPVAPEPKKTVVQKVGDFLQKTKAALFGESVKRNEAGKPTDIQITDDEYAGQVGKVQQYKIEAQKQLDEANQKLKDMVKADPSIRTDLIQEKKIKSLKIAIRNYDEFLGNEQTNRGFFKQLIQSVGDIGILPDGYTGQFEDQRAQAIIKYNKGEDLTKDEQAMVNTFRAEAYQKLIKKGYAESAAEVAAGVPKFGLEMAFFSSMAGQGGGSATALEQAGVKAMMKIPIPILKKVVPKLFANSIQLAVTAQYNIPGIDAKTAEYMTPIVDYEQALGKNSDLLSFLQPGDTPEKARRKAEIDNMINYVSEGVGTYIDDAAPFVKKLFVAKWLSKKGIDTATPSVIKTALKEIRFDQLVSEVIEEEVAEPFQAANEQRKYQNPITTPEGRERLLVETLGIGAFSGMAKVSDKAQDLILNRRKATGDKIDFTPDKEAVVVEDQNGRLNIPEGLPEAVSTELTKKKVTFNDTTEFSGTLQDTAPGGNRPVADLVKTLATKDDQVFRDTVEDYKKKIEAGQTIDPIVVTPQGEVLDGGHRLTALSELGITEAQTVVQGVSKMTEDDKIKLNETVTSQDLGGEPRPGQPADTVRNGQEEQAGTGKTDQVSGTEVARGGSEVSDTGSGERPTARIETAKDAAKDLIRDYVLRGDSLESLKSGQGGSFNGRYNAQIGGYQDGINIGANKIQVSKLNGKDVSEVFSLKKLFDEVSTEKKPKTKTSFKVGDVFDPQGNTNMEGKVTVRAIEGNTLKFTDSKGTEFSGMARSTVRDLIDGGSWKKVSEEAKPEVQPVKEDLNTKLSEVFTDVPENIQQEAEGDWIDNQAEKVSAIQGKIKEIDDNLKAKDLPFPLSKEDKQKLTEEKVALTKDEAAIEDAFVNKWRKKIVENNVPVQVTAKEQVEINKEIEALVAENKQEYSEAEKALMKQYSGAGGLEKAGAEGRGLLDEYYTPKPIVDFMWKKVNEVAKIDEKSQIVEPAVGIGGFLDNAPANSVKVGYEINRTSASIAKILHPELLIENRPFESFFMDERGNKKSFGTPANLVIGNPPYGEHRGRYLGLGEEAKIVKYEEYFIKRGMDILKEEGVLAYVVPSGFIANGENYAKEEIAKQGSLVDAYRLPNGAFGTTTIGTDVVIFKKEPTTDKETIKARVNSMSNDLFFAGNPDKVLGVVSKGTGNYGKDEVKGSLESAMKMAEGKPTKVESEIQPEVIQENQIEQTKEIKEAEEATFSPEEPPVNRVPMSPEARKLNAKAQIIPNKKYGLQNLSNLDRGELEIWKNVSVLGELNESVTSKWTPKSFVNKQVAITFDGETAKYSPNIIYYQGNIYEKLDELELIKDKMSEAQYEIQKAGLTEILPPKQSLSETRLQPIADFVRFIKFDGTSLLDKFRNYMRELDWAAFGSSSSWEIEGYLQGSIVNTGDKVQNVEVRKRRREVGNSLFRRFLSTELTADQIKTIEDRYNRSFNSYYRPDYKQVPLLSAVNDTFNPKGKPGKHPLSVKPVQKEGAAFLATKGAGLLAYDVGVGKTLTGIVAINEVLKRGWAKKPLVIVPNGTYQNWINEISEVIPGVKINSLMNLGAAFKGDLASLEVEDGSISIITYDGLVKLGFKDETYQELTGDLRDVMLGMNNTKRGEEKEAAEVDKQIGRAIKGTTNTRFFEDLGFDHITMDEVHNFKNIFAGAKLDKGKGNEFRNVRGSSSARGIKAYLMAQYVLKNNQNRNVFLLSATPFTNSPLEIYSILSLMAKKRLENIGLKNVNDFMTMFMELTPKFQVKADQSVKEEDIIEKFQNLEQLQKLVTEFIDFRTGEEAGVERPGRVKRTYTLQQTELQAQYTGQAQSLFTDKEKGGAIVAITELQNITLSPYLSRYHAGGFGYKEFVDNSPKIKFAIEGVAQTLKDNPDAGQVVYMPRGVQHFPLLKEYFIKEKGFKASQISEITGGMNIDAKQRVMNDFNSGKVKILMGTEAMKEGVNLQERATDLYHLHLPWNPTDMLQVEGRIWRQGNMWSNVRIHYPLVENSVDSFIFQKLETKEKRIKNLWSYKGKEIDVGDLDFEGMKLDLITDPIIRVKAEQTFETKKEAVKLEQLKVEKSFAENKIRKIVEADESLKYAKEALADELKTYPDSTEADLAYYKKRITKAEEDVAMWRSDLTKKGIDVADLETKAGQLGTQIKAQEDVIANLKGVYDEKLKVAQTEKFEAVVRPNNFYELLKTIADENKTFFTKRAGYEKILMANAADKAPGGNATLGGFADVESLNKEVEGIKAIPFPELLRLVRELTGDVPSLKAFKKALGRFYGTGMGKIKLNPEIFTDPKLAVKVFAHEVGHLFDFLPEKTLTRGNIIGRLNSLNKYLKGKFGESEVTNVEIRDELKELSMLWKPFDELKNPGFTAYRYSSKELYADAVSVLLNDPALLKEKAPIFWTEFFDLLDNKPEVKEAYFSTWKLLNQGEEVIINERLNDLDRMFDRGEDKQRALQLEKQKVKFDFLYQLQILVDNKYTPVNRKVEQVIKAGGVVPDSTNPMYDLQNLSYMDAKIKSFLVKNFQPVYEQAQKVDQGWENLGKIVLLERAIFERGDMANPGGYDPKEAQRTLDGLQNRFTPEEWTNIQKAKELFRGAVEATRALAEENEYYTPELLEQMKANKVYATYQVIDYMDREINARIYKSVGTLKDVANPATSTVMKAIATMKAIEYNNSRKDTISLFQRNFKNDVTPAKTFYNGKYNEPVNPMDRGLGLVTVIEKGKVGGYYLEKQVADSLVFVSSPIIRAANVIMKWLTLAPLYRPLFTTLNLGFQSFNLVRDFLRYWKNIPDKTLKGAIASFPKALYRYGQAIPHALVRAGASKVGFGKFSKELPKDVINEMESLQILGLSYNDSLLIDEEDETKQIERVMIKSGLLSAPAKKGLLKYLNYLMDAIRFTGDAIETLPKVAGYIEMKDKLEPRELAYFLRTKVGSPDFRTAGQLTGVTNSILLFSNAIKEGMKTDYQVATSSKSAAGFWWKTVVVNILPKVMMAAILAGAGGDDDKEILEKTSENDKTNYGIIPLGLDENGKAIILRIPQDETGRLIGGLFWKLYGITAGKNKQTDDYVSDVADLLSFGAGQVPNVTPAWTGMGALVQFLAGKNPYDSFRSRYVIPDTEFKAGWKYSAPIFFDWLAKQQGVAVIAPGYKPNGATTPLQDTLNLPVINNILGRWIKITDYGEKEQMMAVSGKIEREKAQDTLARREAINMAVDKYMAGDKSLSSKWDIQRQLVKEIVPKQRTPEEKTKATNLKKQFNIAILKGRADPDIDSLIYATTNDEKVALLGVIAGRMEAEQFSDFTRQMVKEKVISKDTLTRYKKGK